MLHRYGKKMRMPGRRRWQLSTANLTMNDSWNNDEARNKQGRGIPAIARHKYNAVANSSGLCLFLFPTQPKCC